MLSKDRLKQTSEEKLTMTIVNIYTHPNQIPGYGSAE